MRRGHGIALLTALALYALVPACKEVPTGTLGTELRHGNLGVTVTGYELRHIELQAATGAVHTTREPVLVLHLQVTNYGQAATAYDTRDSAISAQQALTPVLFVDPGEGVELTREHNIPVISVGQNRYMEDPITERTPLGPGETLTDLLLFQQPPSGVTRLKLSLPPTMFGADAETPVWITIPYETPEVIRPPVGERGQDLGGDGFVLRVDDAQVAYLPNADHSGFTEQPVFAVSYTIRNATAGALTYTPPYRSAATAAAPILVDSEPYLSERPTYFNRYVLPAQHSLAGQVTESVNLAPGAELSDVVAFARPGPDTTQVYLLFPGYALGRTGQVRVGMAYAFSDPPLPEALRGGTPPPPPEPTEPAPGAPEEGGEEGGGE